LQPLADVQPDLILPNQSKTVGELLAEAGETGEAIRLMENW